MPNDEVPKIEQVQNFLREDWKEDLPQEILTMPDDSAVGSRTRLYLNLIDIVLDWTNEPDMQEEIRKAAIHQVKVWYFG